MKNIICLCLTLIILYGCKERQQKDSQVAVKSSIRYAKGFDIIKEGNQTVVILKKVFQNSEKEFRYVLSDKKDINKNQLKVPVEKLVVTSTTHIPMVELLDSEKTIVGFPNTKYVSSKKTRALIDNGTIIELGPERDMNTEILLDLNPDLVIGFSLHPNNKLYNNIQKADIPVLFNGDWLEETPLGRAEWIKLFGVLLGKEAQANLIFSNIEKNYLEAKEIAKKATNSPKVLAGNMFKDTWYVPAGESFIAKFLADANLNYLWKGSEGTGSLSLSFESVLDKAHDADFWIGCGSFETKDALVQKHESYEQFTPVKNGNLYTKSLKRGATGGIEFYEFAPIQPDLVLKDLIKIAHPELLPDYELRFYQRLK